MRLIANALVLSSARLTTLLAAVLLNILTARALGPAGRGAYSLPGIDASLASTFLLGLQTATAYFILNRQARGNVLRPALLTIAAFLVLGALLTTAIAAGNGHIWAAIPALLYLPSGAVLSVVTGYWIGRDRMKTYGAVTVSTTVVTLVCVGVALLVFGRTSAHAISGWLLGQAIVAMVALTLVVRDARESGESVAFTDYARFAARTGGLNMVTLLSYRVDVLVVAALAPIEVLGLYSVAVAGAESTFALTYAVNQVTAPRIGATDRHAAAEFVARCTRNTLIGATILATLIGILAPIAVHVFFGTRFLPLIPALRILLVGVVALSTGGVITNYFMLNRAIVRIPLATYGTAATISAVMSLTLVPRLGMVGAALSVTMGYIVGQTVAITTFCRDTGIHPLRLLVIDREDVAFYFRLMASAWQRLRPAT